MGLGVAGQLQMQLAKAWGANPVIGITRSAWKRGLAEKLGADLTLPGGPDALRRVSEATGGRGADLVIETTGMPPVIADGISMSRLGATMLLFGITTATQAALPFYQLYYKELKSGEFESRQGRGLSGVHRLGCARHREARTSGYTRGFAFRARDGNRHAEIGYGRAHEDYSAAFAMKSETIERAELDESIFSACPTCRLIVAALQCIFDRVFKGHSRQSILISRVL